MSEKDNFKSRLRPSHSFPPHVVAEIQRAAAEGIYDIRGAGAKRTIPTFDDLLFLGASMSRYPLEGYRERCDTNVVLGARFAQKPIELKIPITIAGMSFGALSAQAKESLGRGASVMGTSTTTGDGGMTVEERGHSKTLVYQYLPSRYGMNPDDLRKADAIEVVVGQGAKPGGGGMLLGQKISDRVAQMRNLPKGIDQRSACRHPDWTGPDDLEIKISELREITDWQVPIYVKVGATRTFFDTTLAVKAGADVIVVDGMQGGTAATQDIFIEHVGIPTLPATRLAVEALKELNMHRKVQLIVSGGIRNGADVAKALAMGADAVSIGTAAMIALGDNIFHGDKMKIFLREAINNLNDGFSTIFGVKVDNPSEFGVVELNSDNEILSIREKPLNPNSEIIVSGLYFYTNNVLEIVSHLKPSKRGELEITDVNSFYLNQRKLKMIDLSNSVNWVDTGTYKSLIDASNYFQQYEQKSRKKIACVEELVYKMGYINKEQLTEIANDMKSSAYGRYLLEILKYD